VKRLVAFVGVLIILLAAWYAQASFFLESAERNVLLMDTFVGIRVTGRNAEKMADLAVDEMGRLEGLFTAHSLTSEVAAMNSAYPNAVAVSPEVLEVLLLAEEIHQRSGGAFDVTVGGLLRLWGFGTDDLRVPSEAELSAAMHGVGMQYVIIDRQAGTVRTTHPATKIDLGGIAKGYIVDKAVELLKSGGAKHILVDAGGDVRIYGGRPGENRFSEPRPARIGVQDPRSPRNLVAIVSTFEGAVLTSGDYERFFIADGVRYSHIMDPRSGYPSQGVSSVTVVAESAALADGIATAAMVLGVEEGLSLINSWAGVEGMLITEDEQIVLSTTMADITEILKADQ
jgi:FAD:protein FMN transferase